MSDERRFDEQEIAFIIERASAESAATDASAGAGAETEGALPQPRGLTLRQLQEIAAEAGISRDAVTRAASEVQRGALVPTKRSTTAGLPTGVSRTIDIRRRVSDEEWDRIVVALRDTFGARGRVERLGTLREWRNGNLVALLEPTATGHRLRLSTRKGSAQGSITVGGASTVLGGGMLIPMLLAGVNDVGAFAAASTLALGGLGLLVQSIVSLPRWARTRAQQMESLTAQIDGILDDGDAPA